jgi:transcription-repair coupling factor (superfamily II helicase)
MDQNQEKISPERLIDIISVGDHTVDCIGLSGSERAYFVSRLTMAHTESVVVIVPSTKDAEKYLEDLRFFLAKNNPSPIYFPPYNILPFQQLSYHSETAGRRIKSLYRLIVASKDHPKAGSI